MMSADDNETAGLSALWESGQHLRAGADYLAALQKLGLNPECLFWADDDVVGHPVLVLATEQFDRVGPLDLSKTLFKAYDYAGTPKEINPFVMRLHSPRQEIIRNFTDFVEGRVKLDLHFADGTSTKDTDPDGEETFFGGGGLRFTRRWIYRWQLPTKKPSVISMSRQWRRFTQNVDRLAA